MVDTSELASKSGDIEIGITTDVSIIGAGEAGSSRYLSLFPPAQALRVSLKRGQTAGQMIPGVPALVAHGSGGPYLCSVRRKHCIIDADKVKLDRMIPPRSRSGHYPPPTGSIKNMHRRESVILIPRGPFLYQLRCFYSFWSCAHAHAVR